MTGTAAIIKQYAPTCVCIFGDTNTSLGGCLAGVTAGVPVVHIEAGARSHDMTMPEEVNRRLIDHSSDLLLAVSQACVENLIREDVPGSVVDVGDPLYEVFADNMALLPPAHVDRLAKPKCLMTLHRQGLVDDAKALGTVLGSVSRFAEAQNIEVVFPAHPRTATMIKKELAESVDGISVTAPLLYQDLLFLLRGSVLVITDSGGLQKEAFWAGKPCVTVRSTTEWGETVAAGANVLALGEEVGPAAEHMLSVSLSPPSQSTDPYHGLQASMRVVDALVERYARR
jgi:UDP-N-acetylglucosamine 2-epimerase